MRNFPDKYSEVSATKGFLWKENFWLCSSVYFNTKEAIHGKQDSMVLGIKARTLKCLLFSFTKKNETELKSKKWFR